MVHSSTNSETQDGRALVHEADHRLDDECWKINKIQKNGVEGYTITKAMVFILLN